MVSTVDPLFGGVAVVEAARPHPSVKNVPDEEGLHSDDSRAGRDSLELVAGPVSVDIVGVQPLARDARRCLRPVSRDVEHHPEVVPIGVHGCQQRSADRSEVEVELALGPGYDPEDVKYPRPQESRADVRERRLAGEGGAELLRAISYVVWLVVEEAPVRAHVEVKAWVDVRCRDGLGRPHVHVYRVVSAGDLGVDHESREEPDPIRCDLEGQSKVINAAERVDVFGLVRPYLEVW